MARPLTLLLWLFCSLTAGTYVSAAGEQPATTDSVELWFFWSASCPHCQAAHPFVEQLAADSPWIVLHSQALPSTPEAWAEYQRLARLAGVEADSVPAFYFCGQALFGFDTPEGVGRLLKDGLEGCRAGRAQDQTDLINTQLQQQVGLKLGDTSLPVLTLVIAGLDAFNPCAFFVLLFLLSLLVHARSRWRMLLIGGLFVTCSGLVYFLFMGAWLKLFQWAGEVRLLTLGAGLVATFIALVNLRDALSPERSATLAIPAEAKPGLFARMRGLLNADSLPSLVVGTLVLALVANSYELLCTAGFPMLYTRILTLHGLSDGAYLGYLVAYNLVYILPLLAIVLLFTWSLGSRKLQEHEGRSLKVLSGVMMLGLGLLLTLAPEWLNNLFTAITLMLIALLVAWLFKRYGAR